MSSEHLRLFVYFNPAFGQYEMFMGEQRQDGYFVAQPVEFTKAVAGDYSPPMIRLETRDAQRLMDVLWQTGLRPQNGNGGPAQVEAIQKHLDDMRKIAAKSLGVTL